jgi:hypothetical protein
MKSIQTEIMIAASHEKVWTILQDFEKTGSQNKQRFSCDEQSIEAKSRTGIMIVSFFCNFTTEIGNQHCLILNRWMEKR